jgi:hypothetical protein
MERLDAPPDGIERLAIAPLPGSGVNWGRASLG